jgi:thioredoxin reductase/intein/homing endonuclease
METYDLIIIGCGPSGLAAGLYAARRNLKTLVLGEVLGGQVALAHVVENYPGIKPMPGMKLAEKMKKQAKKFGCEFKLAKVVRLDLKSEIKKVKTTDKEFSAKTVIIATGSHYRRLEAEGEDRFIGKGVSYCATCLPPEEEIVANNILTEISHVTPITKVLTASREFKKITGFNESQYKGLLIGIKTRFFTELVYLTPNHLILKTNIKKGSGKEYWKNFTFTKPQWITTKDLRKGDILLYPIIKEIKDIKTLKISDNADVIIDKNGLTHNRKETHTSKKIPNIIPLNEKLLRLIGYYLADGSIARGGINIYFNKKEIEYAKDTKNIIKELFGLGITIKYKYNVCRISIHSTILSKLFENICGKYSYDKYLPHWIITLPKRKQAELIKGFWRGDGCIRDKDFTLVTNSRKLTYQLRDILLRLGIIPSIQRRIKENLNKKLHSIEGRNIKFTHDKYHIVIGGPSLEAMSKVLEIKHPKLENRKKICKHAWINKGYLLLPIRKFNYINYDGSVYDVSIKNDNTFVTKNFIVHNCDGPLFKGKKVAVIGGSDSAVKAAIYLSEIASETYLVHRRNQLRAEEANQENLRKSSVKIIWNSVVEKIEGDKLVNKIIIKNVNTNEKKEIAVDGAFIEVGEIPTTELVKAAGVEVNEKNFIKVDDKFQTNIPGVFASGDVTGSFAQIIVAAAEGAEAATNAYLYLRGGVYGEIKPADYGEKK